MVCCSVVLCCAVLCCAVLCCAMWWCLPIHLPCDLVEMHDIIRLALRGLQYYLSSSFTRAFCKQSVSLSTSLLYPFLTHLSISPLYFFSLLLPLSLYFTPPHLSPFFPPYLPPSLSPVPGSLTVIGSPMGFARKVGSGVKSFFYEPYQGTFC